MTALRSIARSRFVPIVWAAFAAASLPAPVPLRAPVVLGFIVLCPGLGWARALRLRDLATEITVAVSVSIIFALGTSFAVAHAGLAPTTVFALLVALTVAGAGVDLFRGPPREAP